MNILMRLRGTDWLFAVAVAFSGIGLVFQLAWIFSPRDFPPPIQEKMAQNSVTPPVDLNRIFGMFGTVPRSEPVRATAPRASFEPLAVKGVLAGSHRPLALMEVGGLVKLAALGDELHDGSVLMEIGAASVTVNRAGILERVFVGGNRPELLAHNPFAGSRERLLGRAWNDLQGDFPSTAPDAVLSSLREVHADSSSGYQRSPATTTPPFPRRQAGRHLHDPRLRQLRETPPADIENP